jgi:hypothetical protein
MTTDTTPKPPSLVILLGIYSIWISAIVATITIPGFRFLGVLTCALVVFIWLPYWVCVNWSIVADDLPATYATIVVSLIVIVLLGLMFRYDASSIGYRLVKSGWLEPRELGLLNWIEFSLQMGLFYSIYPAWRWFRRAFTRKFTKVA